MDTLTFDLVTPEAVFFSGTASLVEAPGTLGDFGVLAGHMAFISTLRPGVVCVHNDKEGAERIFIAGGIAEVSPGGKKCTILAEQVLDLKRITRTDAEARLAKAKAAMACASEDPERSEAERELALAEAIAAAVS